MTFKRGNIDNFEKVFFFAHCIKSVLTIHADVNIINAVFFLYIIYYFQNQFST